MNLWIRSVLVGTVVTALLESVVIAGGQASSLITFQSIAIYLLAPGIVLGFAIGSGHVHDTSFWVLTAILNALVYSLLAAPCIFALNKIRSRGSSGS